jgi:3-dehydroquinate synthase
MFRVSGMRGPFEEEYDVRVQAGGLDALGGRMRRRGLQGPVVVISDENTARYYLKRTTAGLETAGYRVVAANIPSGEVYKTLETVAGLWDIFLEAGLERGSTVVALGGGVTGDLTGFAAAVYLRGVRWVGVPTTLLAMVDSSLGGKTGADLPQGKNLIGAFHPPALVLADPDALATLPEAEMRSGLAEVVKHGVIADPELFALCESGWDAVCENRAELVRRAMAVKVRVIQEDPYEKGRRASLNLGHTIGHAVELASGFRLRHGEAVAIGMVVEARIAERMGLASSGLADRIAAVLAGLGLPTEIPSDLERGKIMQITSVDKKRSGGRAKYALPCDIGDVRVGIAVEDGLVLSEL